MRQMRARVVKSASARNLPLSSWLRALRQIRGYFKNGVPRWSWHRKVLTFRLIDDLFEDSSGKETDANLLASTSRSEAASYSSRKLHWLSNGWISWTAPIPLKPVQLMTIGEKVIERCLQNRCWEDDLVFAADHSERDHISWHVPLAVNRLVAPSMSNGNFVKSLSIFWVLLSSWSLAYVSGNFSKQYAV